MLIRFIKKFVEMTESTGDATSAAVTQKDSSGKVRCEYQNNICSYQLVVVPEAKHLETKLFFFFFTNFFHDLHFEAIEFLNINFNLTFYI